MMRSCKISILIPCFNEAENIAALCGAVKKVLETELSSYRYEIVLIDNKSSDGTREIIEGLCEQDSNLKAIFNIANFGQFNSPYYGLMQCTGDCVILFSADFQDPVSCIPKMVKEWENGHKVICMVKKTSRENSLMYFIRGCYYKLLKVMIEINPIEHYTGFGLYDKSFIEILKGLNEPTPYFRCIVAEYAPDHLELPYEQQKRQAGKSHNNFMSLYDAAMLSFSSYTKVGLRVVTFFGAAVAAIGFIAAIALILTGILKADGSGAFHAAALFGLFFLGGAQLAAIGFAGEYLMNVNLRIMNKPLVIEERRLNWE